MNGKYVFLIVLVILVTILVLAAGWFYWFEYRPSLIRPFCIEQAKENARQTLVSKNAAFGGMFDELAGQGVYLKVDYEDFYEECLRQHGLDSTRKIGGKSVLET